MEMAAWLIFSYVHIINAFFLYLYTKLICNRFLLPMCSLKNNKNTCLSRSQLPYEAV